MTTTPVEKLIEDKKIYEVIDSRLVQAPPDTPLDQAVQMMKESRARYVVISENKKVVGIFTEADVMKNIIDKKVDWNRPVREFMTKDPVTLSPEDPIVRAMELMSQHRIYHIPLVDENQDLCGLLTVRTIVRYLAECYPTEVYNLPPNPNQVMKTQEGG